MFGKEKIDGDLLGNDYAFPHRLFSLENSCYTLNFDIILYKESDLKIYKMA